MNFESKNEFTISVLAQDDGVPAQSTNANFTITVTDSNDPPYNQQLEGRVVMYIHKLKMHIKTHVL